VIQNESCEEIKGSSNRSIIASWFIRQDESCEGERNFSIQ